MSEEGIIRVLLVDDHPMVLTGVNLFLSSQKDIQVVGQAQSGEEAYRLAGELEPDVICMDLVMPGLGGIEATRLIKERYPQVQILAVTSFIDLDKVLSAIRCGASGYLMKDVSPGELARAIRTAAHEDVYLHPEAVRLLAQHLRPEDDRATSQAPVQPLTNREEDVLKLVARGLNNQDIAEDLGIGLKTVKAHMTAILQKLGLENRVQAAIYALRHNIVSLDDL